MLRIDVISIFPDFLKAPLSYSISGRAMEKGLAEIHYHDLRDYSGNKYRSVDDYPYGGGAGMVLRAEPIADCIDTLKDERDYDEVIYMTPDGELLNQSICNGMSTMNNLIILCGHYKGIDERIREHYITREISVGDYVLSGGEWAAGILIDSLLRLIPGVLGDETSALSDSFQNNLLSPPVYTRPAEFRNWVVPEILLSGHQSRIDDWRLEKALERTKQKRPDLLEDR